MAAAGGGGAGAGGGGGGGGGDERVGERLQAAFVCLNGRTEED